MSVTPPWSLEELAELKLLARNGVRMGDLRDFAIKHKRKYRTVVTRLQTLRSQPVPRLTYAERMALLRAEE
jgi:hypothetical protein